MKILYISPPSKLQVSGKQKAKFFTLKDRDKLPKKYQTPQYGFIGGFLCVLDTKQKVVKNSKSQGTPKFISINWQGIYNGSINRFDRVKIVNFLKDYMLSKFPKDTEAVLATYRKPLKINFIFRGSSRKDIDNHAGFFVKIGFDAIKEFIKDDNLANISGYSVNFEPSTKSELELVIVPALKKKWKLTKKK